MLDMAQYSSAASSRQLLALPDEILQRIVQCCDPTDLGRLSRSCWTLSHFIGDNKLLWKELYLCHYDVPHAPSADWKQDVQDIVLAQKLLANAEVTEKLTQRVAVCNTLLKLVNSIDPDVDSSKNLALLQDAFRDTYNQDTYLCGSSLFAASEGSDQWTVGETEDERQLLAKLHCLYGAPRWGWKTGNDEVDTHCYARARVYDMRNYTQKTRWGPFRNDDSGAVDWEKLEAIITVLGFNLKTFSDRTNGRYMEPMWTEENAWCGASPHSFVSPRPNSIEDGQVTYDYDGERTVEGKVHPELTERDPYNVTGTWHRVVCFLDYYDFFSYNFQQTQRSDRVRQHLDSTEAIRLIQMRYWVTRIDEQEDGVLPIVHFKGDSRSIILAPGDPNANSDIIGVVRQTPEGEIRWTTWSVYDGERRWRSEGIQVGGIQSARGVIGNWFDTEYDPHGPAGPTAFWKISDRLLTGHSPSRTNLSNL